jgi:squalene-hopene/tetraprenyl-beta-curcumene cyclase
MNRLARVICLTALPAFCQDWSPRLAADYLDGRQKQWFAWKPASATGGPCVSCHTGVTYLFARPALRAALGEKERTPYELGLTAGLRARVGHNDAREVFRSHTKEPFLSQAFGVEAVLSALFLTLEEAPEAAQALDRMWLSQIREGPARGSWPWFNLDLEPWETSTAQFYGATLAALAISKAPTAYRERPDVRERSADLSVYLAREQPAQPLHNRLLLLWAARTLPQALSIQARKAIVDEAWRRQQEDGGWTMNSLGPWKAHTTASTVTDVSNSYATGLTALALTKAGLLRSDARLQRALAWLKTHQDPTSGSWPAESMNKVFPPESMMAKFMQDAATAYSAMALIE